MKPKKLKPFNKRTQKSLLTFLSSPLGELTKFTSIITIVLLLSWGISRADDLNPFTPSIEDATTNFSVIGTVASIDETHLILTQAKGSDDTGEQEYNLNIKHLETIQTNTYNTLTLTDIHTGDTIIAQGLTTGSVFFIKRIISFSSTPLPEQTATTTPEVATTTEDIATTTEETPTPQETSPSESNTSSTPEPLPLTEPTPTPTSTPEESQDIASSTLETITTILEDGITTISDTLTNIVNTLTPEPQPEPTPEPLPPTEPESTLTPEPTPEAPPTQ